MDVPYKEADYQPVAAAAFFGDRPLEALGRLAQLARLSGGFISALVLDKALQREEQQEVIDARSQQLLELVTQLGPTFIKVGQALSIRTDLLPAPYVAGLTQLQDAVPPFSGAQGRAIIEEELSIDLDRTFSKISLEPVASASIGQVYRATMREGGQEVAIKVQRPNVLYNVALDLFMMREILVPLYQRLNPESKTNLLKLVDAWGEGFVNELDYRLEAEATTAFSAAMVERGLGSVIAPEVIGELSSAHVLTTKWVDGQRLADSSADDVPRLCGVALNAYLTMLLDTGCLHCDPHPGNLLRTSDGKLCILDWGMTQAVPQDLQLALLEFIADLQGENYERVPDDLVELGFVPRDAIDELRSSGLTYGITEMLKLAAKGGGPKGAMESLVEQNKQRYGADLMREFGTLDSPEAIKERQRRFREDYRKEMAMDSLARGAGDGGSDGPAPSSTTMDLTQKIERLQQQNSDVFAIPDYFVYMSRAFATLEGIGLSSDPKYSILNECFPYLAKRLLSDDSPRARGALRTLLYGTGEELNLDKLRDVTAGLESYTASTASVESSRGVSDEGKNAAAEQLAAVVLAEESNYVQQLLLREAAVALDASVRNSFASSIVAPLRRLAPPNISPPPLPTPLAPLLEPLARPLTLPLELARATLELQELDDRDAKRLDNLRILTDLASGATTGNAESAVAGGGSRSFGGANMGSLAREAAERRTALARIGVRFSGVVARTQAERLRQRREGQAGELSELAGRLAVASAERLEDVASAITSLDENLGAAGSGAGD